MPVSNIDICNRALLRLGHDEIASFNEKSKEARYCKAFYEPMRELTLRSHPWNFATRFAKLALLTATVTDYDYVYALPADEVRSLYIVNPLRYINSSSPSMRMDPAPQIPFELRNIDGFGKVLVCGQVDAELAYVYNNKDPNAFDGQFVDALSHRLASELARPLAGKPALQTTELQLFILTLNEGKQIDANESRTQVQPGQDLVSSRR